MTSLLVTFSRRVDQPFEQSLGALERWRASTSRGTDVRCATIDAGPDDAPERYRLELRIRGPVRSLPMEVRVTPWSETDTHIELLPLRTVRPSRRYFRHSRVVLNDLVAAIAAGSINPGEPRQIVPSSFLRQSA